MVDRGRGKWFSLVTGSVMMLFLGLIYAWSIFRVPLEGLFPPWTPTQISVTFTISIVLFCAGGLLSGKLLQSVRVRSVTRLSAGMLLVGFLLLSLFLDEGHPARSLAALYVFYGVLCGFGVGLSYNCLISGISRHFPDKPGMATGILLMSFGIGGMVLGSLVDFLCRQVGVKDTFAICGILVTAVLVVGSFLMGEAPPPGKASAGGGGHTLGQAMRTLSFWLLCLWVTATCTCGLMILNSAATIAVSFGAPAVLGLVVSVFNGIGRFAFGPLIDRLGRRAVTLTASSVLVLGGVLLLLGGTQHSTALIFIGLPLIGLTYGGAPTNVTAAVNLLYGQQYFPVIYGAATFSVAASAILGPILASRMQEASGGGFSSTFAMIVAFGLISFALHFLLAAASRKEGLE